MKTGDTIVFNHAITSLKFYQPRALYIKESIVSQDSLSKGTSDWIEHEKT